MEELPSPFLQIMNVNTLVLSDVPSGLRFIEDMQEYELTGPITFNEAADLVNIFRKGEGRDSAPFVHSFLHSLVLSSLIPLSCPFFSFSQRRFVLLLYRAHLNGNL